MTRAIRAEFNVISTLQDSWPPQFFLTCAVPAEEKPPARSTRWIWAGGCSRSRSFRGPFVVRLATPGVAFRNRAPESLASAAALLVA